MFFPRVNNFQLIMFVFCVLEVIRSKHFSVSAYVLGIKKLLLGFRVSTSVLEKFKSDTIRQYFH